MTGYEATNTGASLETVTPEFAAVCLERQAGNRRVKDRQVRRLARDMARGAWRVNGETLKFYTDGRLADGQHRLLACVKAATPFVTWVIRGLTEPDRDTVDKGSARTLGDTLTLRGIAHANTLASALSWYARLKAAAPSMQPGAENTPTEAEANELLEKTGVAQSVEFIGTLRRGETVRVIPGGLAAGLHCVFTEECGRQTADAFFQQVIQGLGLLPESVVRALRARLSDSKARYRDIEIAALTIKTFNAFRAHRQIGVLKWTRRGKSQEAFPSWR